MHESPPCEGGARRAGDDKRLKIEMSVEINFFQESPFVPLERKGEMKNIIIFYELFGLNIISKFLDLCFIFYNKHGVKMKLEFTLLVILFIFSFNQCNAHNPDNLSGVLPGIRVFGNYENIGLNPDINAYWGFLNGGISADLQ